MLNADELGEKGQAHFREICADAKLICNSSDRDRTGWDFIVEFPFGTAVPVSLEDRATPLSCHVQVKTLYEKTDRFAMRLSSAERLAKEMKPSFVYVFKVNESLEFTGAYLVHFIDEPLGRILKRLRKEDLTPSAALNRKTITMSASALGLSLPPSGEALRNAMERFCGADVHDYAAKKSKQLKKTWIRRPSFRSKDDYDSEQSGAGHRRSARFD
jgi:hypothetical protein